MAFVTNVSEADVGLIKTGQPVHFTVSAYPDEPFEGKITQVRLGPKAALPGVPVNVVTYTAVVEAPNAELKLLPGMTAELVFQIEKHENVLKVPNAALRFHPKPEYVYPKHLALLEGLHAENEDEGDEKTAKTAKQDEDADADPASDKETASKKEVKRYVWVVDGDLLSPLEIKVGINDSHHTEMISGDIKQDQKVVTGIKTAAEAVASQKSK